MTQKSPCCTMDFESREKIFDIRSCSSWQCGKTQPWLLFITIFFRSSVKVNVDEHPPPKKTRKITS